MPSWRRRRSFAGAACWASLRRRYTAWEPTGSTRTRCAVFSRLRDGHRTTPLILHVPDAGWLERCCVDIPDTAYALAERFWPGPLTMILPRRDCVPLRTTGGLDTVGVRCPDHPVTRAIIAAADTPVAAPSGNTSGRPSPTCARHMMEDMMGKIDGIVDGGPCAVGVESTIIDLTVQPPRLRGPADCRWRHWRRCWGRWPWTRPCGRSCPTGRRPRHRE